MGLEAYRASAGESAREADLRRLLDRTQGRRALDIGARDGHYSRLLAERFEEVVALDLECPSFVAQGVTCVAGDATGLEFPDAHFDLVFCAEVLEHIPEPGLAAACARSHGPVQGTPS